MEPNRCCISSIALVLLKTGITHPPNNEPVSVDYTQMATAQKLLLFWRKPARKCWWDGLEVELPKGDKVKLWARRVWTLELSLVGPFSSLEMTGSEADARTGAGLINGLDTDITS